MPQALIPLKTPCRHPGCGQLLTTPGYCTAHARTTPTAKAVYDQTRRKDDPALAAAARFRSSMAWQNFRAWMRARYPLCCDPFSDHGEMHEPTHAFHHVIPLHERADLGLVEGNCRPLCIRCHNRIEGMERRGEATRHLFASSAQMQTQLHDSM